MRAQNAATSAGVLLAPGPVGEVLGERDRGAARAAEELVERHAGLARRDVPERDLDSGERLIDQHLPVGAMRGDGERDAAELGAHLIRVAADEPLSELTATPERRPPARRSLRNPTTPSSVVTRTIVRQTPATVPGAIR